MGAAGLISQAGAGEAARESQQKGVSPGTRHYQFSQKPPELGQTSALQPAAPGSLAPAVPNALIASGRRTERVRQEL